jgi:hypothetical protein
MLAEVLRGDDTLDRNVKDIQPTVLFHPNVRPDLKVFRQFRDIYLSLGVNVNSRRGYPIIKRWHMFTPEGIRNHALV